MVVCFAVGRHPLATCTLQEVIVGVVRGVAGHHSLDWTVVTTAVLGMLLAIGLWWLYFDFVSQRMPKAHGGTLLWIYLHLVTTMGIVASGAATLNVVEHAADPLPPAVRWLLVATIALTLISIALLMRALELPETHAPLYRTATSVTLFSAAAVLGLGFSTMPTVALLVAVNLLMLLPVLWGLRVWIDVHGGDAGFTNPEAS